MLYAVSLRMRAAMTIAHPGGFAGRVGVPEDESIPLAKETFSDNITNRESIKVMIER